MILTIISFLFFLLYVALPAFVANMLPVIVDKLGWLKGMYKPIDGGKFFRGQPLFGPNKTWRGLMVGTLGGGVVGLLQYALAISGVIPVLFFTNLPKTIIFGLLAGLGALFGDLAASFIKRRLKKPSGAAWPVIDHIDYILGFLLFTSLIINWTLVDVIVLVLFASLANPLTNKISFKLGIKSTPT